MGKREQKEKSYLQTEDRVMKTAAVYFGQELLKTLECYFENGNNLRKTAEDLFLHKNSVKYRISRIEQLLGDRISNPEVELNLRICLKYRQIL